MVWAAVETSPREFIIEAKATKPRDVPKRWSIFGKATFKQGRRISGSGAIFCPFGERNGWFQRTAVIRIPPTVKAIALAIP